jgi:hypothetical protein
MIYMEPGLSPGYRREEEEEGKEGLEEEEEKASPGFVDSWLRRCTHTSLLIMHYVTSTKSISICDNNG